MTQTITATFEDGVLKPTRPLDLPERTRVQLTIEIPESEIQKQWDATKEQRLAALEEPWKNPVCSTEPHMTREQLNYRRSYD